MAGQPGNKANIFSKFGMIPKKYFKNNFGKLMKNFQKILSKYWKFFKENIEKKLTKFLTYSKVNFPFAPLHLWFSIPVE